MYQTSLSFKIQLQWSTIYLSILPINAYDTFHFGYSIDNKKSTIEYEKKKEGPQASIKRSYNHNCKCSTFVLSLFNASLSLFCLVFISFVSFSSTLGFFLSPYVHFLVFVVRFDLSFARSLCRPGYLQAMGWVCK